jgi:LuxR family transcriptional regulator, quorum-sensing system regulator BjaR1
MRLAGLLQKHCLRKLLKSHDLSLPMSSRTADAAFLSALAIEGAEKMSVIEGEVRNFAGQLGYNRFALLSTATGHDEVVQNIYWIEGRWFDEASDISAETYFQRCPMTRHVFSVHEPFFWTKLGAEDEAQYKVVRTPQGGGIHGLQVPIFGPIGLEGAMSLGGEKIDSSQQARLALTLIAVSAFYAARRILEGSPENRFGLLSGREREVLAWTAAGRRQFEIAATLGLSERTIENHLRRIRKRLGVATTSQAIRIAIRNGDIEA